MFLGRCELGDEGSGSVVGGDEAHEDGGTRLAVSDELAVTEEECESPVEES